MNAACQRTLNLVAEVIEDLNGEPIVSYLKGSPGLAAALLTLPTQPLRGLFGGGAPLSNADQMFAVSGSKLYEISSAGAIVGGTHRGDVGNDGYPAQMFASGLQLYIVSAGQAYIDNGGAASGANATVLNFIANQGTVDTGNVISAASNANPASLTRNAHGLTTGASVTISGFTGSWTPANATFTITRTGANTFTIPVDSTGFGALAGSPVYNPLDVLLKTGTQFTQGMVGQLITINAVNYTVDIVKDATHLTLTGSAGVQTSVAYISKQIEGTCDTRLTKVTWLSGPLFTPQMAGNAIVISGIPYTVATVEDGTHLTLTAGLISIFGQVWSIAGASVLARTGAILDNFLIAALDNSKQLNVSLAGDGNNWDPADVAMKESYPDNIGAILADHGELLVLGESHGEVWGPPGDANFPFARIEAYTINIGIAAPWSLCGMAEGPIWIGAAQRGKPIAYFAKGFAPVRISTHAVEQAWAGYAAVYAAAAIPLLFDAQAFVYEMDGHEFWQVSFPIAGKTWVYDRTASKQLDKPIWAERTSSVSYTDIVIGGSPLTGTSAAKPFTTANAGDFLVITGGGGFTAQTVTILSVAAGVATMSAPLGIAASTGGTGSLLARHRASCHCYVFDRHWVGDFATGAIYEMDSDLYQDAGQTIFCIRTLPHISSERLRLFFQKLQLDLETGGGVALTIVLEWSDDGGTTFVGGWSLTASTTKKLDRLTWFMLGSSEDRVWRITVTGNARKALLGLYGDVVQGIS